MARKKMKVTKKQKNNAVMNDINGLHICINQDYDQLEKLYTKTVISANKNVLTAKKALAKAKKQLSKTKNVKAKAPKVYQSALSEAHILQKQLDVQKEEHACIAAGYTKFNAQQKALLKFEKEWAKKAPSAKKKPMKKRKIVTENAMPEVVVSQIS